MFNSYLEDIFLKENPQVTKDESEDAFENWLSELSVQDVIEYGNLALDELYKQKALNL